MRGLLRRRSTRARRRRPAPRNIDRGGPMADARDPQAPDTIVLINGLWLTALSLEHWKARYEARGYTVIASDWPGMEGDIADLREDASFIDGLGIAEIVDHYAGIVSSLDRPPIIMGHSFGGAFTEILL